MANIKSRDITVLKRRRDYLLKRVGMSDDDLSYDKQEAAALDRAIKVLEELELDYYRSNSNGKDLYI